MSACDIPIRCSVVGAHCLFSSSGRTTRSQSGTSTRIVAVANTDTDAGGMSKLPNLRCIDSACWTMIVASCAYPRFQIRSVAQMGMIRKSCFASSTWLTGTKSVGSGSPKSGQETPAGTTAARSSQRMDSVWASGGGGAQSSRRRASSSPPEESAPSALLLPNPFLFPAARRNPPTAASLTAQPPESLASGSPSSKSAS